MFISRRSSRNISFNANFHGILQSLLKQLLLLKILVRQQREGHLANHTNNMKHCKLKCEMQRYTLGEQIALNFPWLRVWVVTLYHLFVYWP